MTPDLNRLRSERGRIQPPNLDDRSWQDLVDQMRALIPRYVPGWTDHNPSDMGMALVELVAWLGEQIIYRLNRVPEKNYIAFLNLLGITRDPATPARTYLTFSAGEQVVHLAPGVQVQTIGRETEPPVIFETDAPLTVLPIDLKAVLRFEDDGEYDNLSKLLIQAPAGRLTLMLNQNEMQVLCLGFSGPTSEAIRLMLHLSVPLRVQATQRDQPEVMVEWVYPAAATSPSQWQDGVFGDLDDIPPVDPGRAAEQWRESGTVVFTPPPDWPAHLPTHWNEGHLPKIPTDAVRTPLHWVAVRLTGQVTTEVTVELESLLFNAVSARNALSVTDANPDRFTSAGSPDQRYTLRHSPVLVEPGAVDAYRWLHLTVTERSGEAQTWLPVEEFPASDARVFRCSTTTGEVQFGDHDPQTKLGRGAVPPEGATITATYRYVAGGANGNVGAGTLTVLGQPRAQAPGIRAVTNLLPATGGSDEEALEDTLRRAPDELRTHSRAVTAEDYEFLAREASTDVARAFCLTPRNDDEGQPWLYAGVDRSPGKVAVIVVPRTGPDPSRPYPSVDLLREIQAYLDRRRDLTADLTVRGPLYLPIKVTVEVTLFGKPGDTGIDQTMLIADLSTRAKAYLHPLTGGPDGTGWTPGQRVITAGLFRVLMPRADGGYISDLKISAQLPTYLLHLSGPVEVEVERDRPNALDQDRTSVRVEDYELVCSAPEHTINIQTEQQ